VWGREERSNRVQPQRVEVRCDPDVSWRIISYPWWLRCRAGDGELQLVVRNCGSHRGFVRLRSEAGDAALPVESHVRATGAAATKGGAIAAAYGGFGTVAALLAAQSVYSVVASLVNEAPEGELVPTAAVLLTWGALAGAALGQAVGRLALVARSAAGGAMGALAGGGFTWLVAWFVREQAFAAPSPFLVLVFVASGIWVLVGAGWGSVVGGWWLGVRGAGAGLLASLIAVPLGILVTLPWIDTAAWRSGFSGALFAAIPAAGLVLLLGFMGALLAPCRIPK